MRDIQHQLKKEFKTGAHLFSVAAALDCFHAASVSRSFYSIYYLCVLAFRFHVYLSGLPAEQAFYLSDHLYYDRVHSAFVHSADTALPHTAGFHPDAAVRKFVLSSDLRHPLPAWTSGTDLQIYRKCRGYRQNFSRQQLYSDLLYRKLCQAVYGGYSAQLFLSVFDIPACRMHQRRHYLRLPKDPQTETADRNVSFLSSDRGTADRPGA